MKKKNLYTDHYYLGNKESLAVKIKWNNKMVRWQNSHLHQKVKKCS